MLDSMAVFTHELNSKSQLWAACSSQCTARSTARKQKKVLLDKLLTTQHKKQAGVTHPGPA